MRTFLSRSIALASAGLVFLGGGLAAQNSAIRISISGLQSTATTGGTAVVTRTDITGVSPVTVQVSSSGAGSVKASPGTYSVQYSPPSGYVLASGQANPKTTSPGSGRTGQVAWTVQVVAVTTAVTTTTTTTTTTATTTSTSSTGAGPGPNEPAGMTRLFDNGMSGNPQTLTADQYGYITFAKSTGGTQADEVSVVSDATAPASPPTHWRHTTPQGSLGEPHWRATLVQNLPPNSGTWYMRVRVRFAADFSFSGYADVKFFSPRQADVGHNHFVGFTRDGTNIGFWLVNQGTLQDKAWRSTGTNSPVVPGIPRGEWVDLEFLATPNTPGVNDGTFTVFVNGTRRWTVSDMRWVDAGQNPTLNRIFIDWIYSSGSTTGMPMQTFDVDHWYLSIK